MYCHHQEGHGVYVQDKSYTVIVTSSILFQNSVVAYGTQNVAAKGSGNTIQSMKQVNKKSLHFPSVIF